MNIYFSYFWNGNNDTSFSILFIHLHTYLVPGIGETALSKIDKNACFHDPYILKEG